MAELSDTSSSFLAVFTGTVGYALMVLGAIPLAKPTWVARKGLPEGVTPAEAGYLPPTLSDLAYAGLRAFFDLHTFLLFDLSAIEGPYRMLVVVPPLVLFVAGFVTAHFSSGPASISLGAKVTWVYLPLVAFPLGIFGGSVVLILLPGFVYPVVFGGMGGFLAAELEHSRVARRNAGSVD